MARGRAMACALLVLGACRDAPETSRWPMQRAEGALALQVRHPLPGDVATASGRDYVMGSVGNGDASLTVDGAPVHVEPNGAFLAWVRVPPRGYDIVARLRGDSARAMVQVGAGAPADSMPAGPASPNAPVRGSVAVITPAGQAPVGQVPARLEDAGDYAWFLLPGTRGEVVESRGRARRVRLSPALSVWVDAQFLRATTPRRSAAPVPSSVQAVVLSGETDVMVPAAEPLPYEVRERDGGLDFHVSNLRARDGVFTLPAASYVARVNAGNADGTTTRVQVDLRGPVYGYDVTWRRGAMVLRVRHPPFVDAVRPLAGLAVVVDAGHPPGGAVGPTGLAEPAVTLDVARRLAAILGERGARVMMTRTDTGAVSLDDRVARALAANGNAFVSIHADAVASGADPSRDVGTAVFAYHPLAMPLAATVRLTLAEQLALPDRGVRRGDYAVVRNSWMPAVLCEGATLTVPRQEAALADSSFRAAYALGIANGIELYFRQLRIHTAPR